MLRHGQTKVKHSVKAGQPQHTCGSNMSSLCSTASAQVPSMRLSAWPRAAHAHSALLRFWLLMRSMRAVHSCKQNQSTTTMSVARLDGMKRSDDLHASRLRKPVIIQQQQAHVQLYSFAGCTKHMHVSATAANLSPAQTDTIHCSNTATAAAKNINQHTGPGRTCSTACRKTGSLWPNVAHAHSRLLRPCTSYAPMSDRQCASSCSNSSSSR
jgi:hypothetical protein